MIDRTAWLLEFQGYYLKPREDEYPGLGYEFFSEKWQGPIVPVPKEGNRQRNNFCVSVTTLLWFLLKNDILRFLREFHTPVCCYYLQLLRKCKYWEGVGPPFPECSGFLTASRSAGMAVCHFVQLEMTSA